MRALHLYLSISPIRDVLNSSQYLKLISAFLSLFVCACVYINCKDIFSGQMKGFCLPFAFQKTTGQQDLRNMIISWNAYCMKAIVLTVKIKCF